MKGYSTLTITFLLFMVLLLSFCAQTTKAEGDNNSTANSSTAAEEDRASKFLSLFSIVRFANTVCYGTNSYNGTCYTSAECSSYGGTGAGTCAAGFGVCCVITISTCGTTTALNSTYWENPSYSSSYYTAGQCSLYVTKCSSNICQLRLDFIAFTLAAPYSAALTSAGQCLTDVFTTSGQSNPVPPICGSNANQHIYLDMTPSTSTFSLNMILTGTSTARLWNIRISQIPCGTSYTAPDNCLQWFTDPTGTVMSFNYLFASTPVVQHLAYQDYQICIRANTGFCGIAYAVCSTVPTASAFAISGTSAGVAATTTALTDTSCNTDWLLIPCATDQMNSAVLSTSTTTTFVGCVAKICGVIFSSTTTATTAATVYSYVKPFIMYFHTDAYEYEATVTTISASTGSFGFCIGYTLQACTTTTYTTG